MLQLMISYWDVEAEYFILDGKSMWIKVEDIYLLIGLSRHGELSIFKYRIFRGMTIEEYIAIYCVSSTQKVRS